MKDLRFDILLEHLPKMECKHYLYEAIACKKMLTQHGDYAIVGCDGTIQKCQYIGGKV